MTQESIASFINDFQTLVQQPDRFLNCDESLQRSIKSNLKQLYDFSKSQEIKVTVSNALPELLLKNFDNEQIWQQIELQNDTVLSKSLKNLSKLLVVKEKLVFKNLEKEITNCNESNSDNEQDSNDINEENESNKQTEDVDISEASEDVDLEDINKSDDEEEINELNLKNQTVKKTIVDDEFFKLDEMEKFLDAEEKKLQDPDSGNDSEDSEKESEDNINLFEDYNDEEDDKVRTARYKDFFVAKEENKTSKRNKFLQDMSDEDEQVKSTYEIRQERLKKKIDKLEQAAISEKPWPLKGEIKADNRPYNSLLEEVVEFDLTSRPAPLITEKTTFQLEDIIKQRIKDKVFDSPKRKIKPVETPLEYKKKLVLDQEKSKHSLAQIYEKEFLEQQAALNSDNADKEVEEDESHKELRKLMQSLFNKLDALSNFHFTPKPAIPELKIVNNLPAVSMEEVTPVTASAASLLAPEEIRNKAKGDILGKSEKTKTDKKRERRKKKQKQHNHIKQINKNLLTKGVGKQDANKKRLMKHITKDKNIQKMDEKTNSKSFKSSKAFFTQLQEEVQTHISEKVKKKRKNTENKMEAKKFKL